MKLLTARFVTSATGVEGIPHDGVPHLALVGRSNVGKSSLINALARNKTLARTSGAAGKTRLANLYRFDVEGGHGGPGRWSVYLADLPGYGYARGARGGPDAAGGRESVAELRRIAERYFSFDGIAGVLHLVDARHPGLDSDLDAAEWLTTRNVETATIATKVDKLSRSERTRNLTALERQLGMAALPMSAVSGEGLDDLWTLIARLTRR